MKNYTKIKPIIDKTAYVSKSAVVTGKVSVGRHSSIWHGSVLRADINEIRIGNYTNIQDLCVLHVADNEKVKIGNYVTVGHNANIHGCAIEDGVLVGIGAIVLNGAVLEKGCQVAAGSVVPGGKVIGKNTLAMGIPARAIRKLTKSEQKQNLNWAKKYKKLKDIYLPR